MHVLVSVCVAKRYILCVTNARCNLIAFFYSCSLLMQMSLFRRTARREREEQEDRYSTSRWTPVIKDVMEVCMHMCLCVCVYVCVCCYQRAVLGCFLTHHLQQKGGEGERERDDRGRTDRSQGAKKPGREGGRER